MSSSTSSGSVTLSIPLTGLGFLTWLVFLILKLSVPAFSTAVSWFWVWFPLWIPWAILLVILIIAVPLILIFGDNY